MKQLLLCVGLLSIVITACLKTPLVKKKERVGGAQTDGKYSESGSLTIYPNNFQGVPELANVKKENYKPSVTKTFDLVHTKLSLSFDWGKQYVYGIANLILKPHFYKQNQLILDARGFEIRYIKLINEIKTEDEDLK